MCTIGMQAVRRRFDKRIYIPLPDLKARQHMFKVPFLLFLILKMFWGGIIFHMDWMPGWSQVSTFFFSTSILVVIACHQVLIFMLYLFLVEVCKSSDHFHTPGVFAASELSHFCVLHFTGAFGGYSKQFDRTWLRGFGKEDWWIFRFRYRCLCEYLKSCI
jgi:hypothetical protein